MGLIQLCSLFKINGGVQTLIVMSYWFMIAAVFTIVTRIQIENAYEKTMQELAKATSAVAQGDFIGSAWK